MVQPFNVKMDEIVTKLEEIWVEIYGDNEKSIENRRKNFNVYCCEFLDTLVNDEMKAKEKISQQIKSLNSEIDILTLELSLEKEILVENFGSLLAIENHLRIVRSNLLIERKEQLNRQIQLQADEAQLCQQLKETPVYVKTGTLATKQEYEEIIANIANLMNLRDERLLVVSKARSHVIEMNKNLTDFCISIRDSGNCSSTTNRENSYLVSVIKNSKAFYECVINSETSNMSLIDSDCMRRLAILEKELVCIETEKKQTVACLKIEIENCLKRVSLTDMECPLDRVGDSCGPLAIGMLTLYRDKLVMERKKHLKDFTLQAQKDFTSVCENCFLTIDDDVVEPYRHLFDSKTYTEENLTSLENALGFIESYYQKYTPLFNKILKWNTEWDQYSILESKMQDPYRFKNRGGNLLKEEKERGKIKRMLPKLEDNIAKLINTWEDDIGCIFTVDGMLFKNYIECKKNCFTKQNLETTKNREISKKMKTENELLYGSKPESSKRFIGMPSQVRNEKRLPNKKIKNTPKKKIKGDFTEPCDSLRGTFTKTPQTKSRVLPDKILDYGGFEMAVNNSGKKKQSSFFKDME